MNIRRIINLFIILLSMNACTNHQPKIGYSGEDISQNASVHKGEGSDRLVLDIQTAGDWQLYMGPAPKTIALGKPFMTGSGSGSFTIDKENEERLYFELVTEEGSAILAERHLPLEGGYNLRDLGGYRTKEGKYTKWGKLYRADDLSKLTNNDLEYMSLLPIYTIVDFRSDYEAEEAPDKHPASLKHYRPLRIAPGNLTEAIVENRGQITAGQADTMMIDIYKQLVNDSVSIKQYSEFFQLLQDESNTPLLFHCSAGKDRTGFASYLILSALGVDEETIISDYLLSNQYLTEKYAPIANTYPALAPLFGVKREFLKASINEIKKQGGIDNYLKNILNVDIQKMKELYLE